MADFFYDEFDDESIDANWYEQLGGGSGSAVEQNDRLELQADATTNYYWAQDFLEASFDVWMLVELPVYDTSGDILVGFYMEDVSTEDDCSCYLRREAANDWWELYSTWSNGGSDNIVLTDVAVVDNKVWLRMRYRPEKGDTYISTYYALSDPLVGGWTEFKVPSATPQLTNNNYRISIRNQNNQTSSRTVYFYNATEFIDLLTVDRHLTSSGSVEEVAAALEAQLETIDDAKAIQYIRIIQDSRDKDMVKGVLITDT